MPRGDSLKKYWEAYRRGEVELGENHGKRGPDKPETVRAIGDNRTLQQRYFERTGRRMDQEMSAEREMIDMMFLEASECDDPERRFDLLSKCQAAQARFNTTWAKFMEHGLGTIQTEQTIEEKRSLDDALSGKLEIADETKRSK